MVSQGGLRKQARDSRVTFFALLWGGSEGSESRGDRLIAARHGRLFLERGGCRNVPSLSSGVALPAMKCSMCTMKITVIYAISAQNCAYMHKYIF